MPATYRIDCFEVPAAARDAFLHAVAGTHDVLRAQPGFVRDLIAEQTSGPGRLNLITLVEWDSEAAIPGAIQAVQAHHAATGFDPKRFVAASGITPHLGFFREANLPH
jgi:hypothetical protein